MESMHYFNGSRTQSTITAQPTLSSTLNKKPKQYSKHFEISGTPNERYEKLQTKEFNDAIHRDFQRRTHGSFSQGARKSINPELANLKLEQIQRRKRMKNDKIKIDLAKRNTQENPIVIDGNNYGINYDDKRYRDVLQNLFTQKSGIQYEWFKEERGYKHWVLYRTDQFEIKTVQANSLIYLHDRNMPTHFKYLHYKGNCGEDVEFPVNVTSCFLMFSNVHFRKKSNIKIKPIAEHSFSTDTNNAEHSFSQDTNTFYKGSSSKVIDFVGAFSGTKFEVHSQFPNSFSTKNAVKMDGMFYSAELLGGVTLPEGFSTENVVSMEYMFSRSFLGESVKFPKEFNTENVFTMEGMFYACNLSDNPFDNDLSANSPFNTKQVIDMSEMFNSTQTMAKNFKLPISFSLDTSIYSKHMFYGGSLGIQFYLKDKTNREIVEILKEWGSQGKPVNELF